MEKKHESPPGNYCSMSLIMHGINSYSARCKYHLTLKKLVCKHFYSPLILEVWLPDLYSVFNDVSWGDNCSGKPPIGCCLEFKPKFKSCSSHLRYGFHV